MALPEMNPDLVDALSSYSFPGNIRELENILERAVALCEGGNITIDDLSLPVATNNKQHPCNQSSSCEPFYNEPLDDFLLRIEKEIILKALEKNNNNKTRTAESLGISFRSFRYKLKKLAIDPSS